MKYNDYELLDLIYENDEVAYNILYKKYMPLIVTKAKLCYKLFSKYNYTSMSFYDFLVEGKVALDMAVKKFDHNKGVLFYSFFLICLESRYNTFLRDLLSKKNIMFYSSRELDFEINDSSCVNPYEYVETSNTYSLIYDYIDTLSLEDSSILILRLQSFKYREIMELLDVNLSKVSRVIAKFKKTFENRFL